MQDDASPPANERYVAAYLVGEQIQVFSFVSSEAYWEWYAELTDIKDHIASINEESDYSRRLFLYSSWLWNRVYPFHRRYGGDLVPFDVKAAVNDVERAFDRPMTLW